MNLVYRFRSGHVVSIETNRDEKNIPYHSPWKEGHADIPLTSEYQVVNVLSLREYSHSLIMDFFGDLKATLPLDAFKDNYSPHTLDFLVAQKFLGKTHFGIDFNRSLPASSRFSQREKEVSVDEAGFLLTPRLASYTYIRESYPSTLEYWMMGDKDIEFYEFYFHDDESSRVEQFVYRLEEQEEWERRRWEEIQEKKRQRRLKRATKNEAPHSELLPTSKLVC